MILLDTNVLSEVLRPAPDPVVARWLNLNFADAAVSAVSVLELLGGTAILPAGQRRDILEKAIDRIVRRFAGRVHAFDEAAARAAARLIEQARVRGKGAHQLPEKLADLQIAGTAVAYDLSLATRNTGDFEAFGITLIDPWRMS
ncbi:MAG: PIN domain-containing protein [Micropepsaceae bacterium]